MIVETAGHPGGAVARSPSRVGWLSRLARDWVVIVITAVATALFTAAGGYIASVSVENEKVRSANVIKLSDDFQTRFAALMTSLQKFTAASIQQKKISEEEKAELSASILTMQLMMSPATGRWPENVSSEANQFFRDLADFDKMVRGATSFSDVETIDKIVKQLVSDDLALIRAMEAGAQIRYFSL